MMALFMPLQAWVYNNGNRRVDLYYLVTEIVKYV